MNFARVHSPRLTDASAWGIRARQREEQRDRVLGSGDDIAAGRIDDEDSFSRRRRHVDVVDSDAGATDDAQLAAGFEDRRRDIRLAPHDQRVEIWDELDQLGLRQLADHRHLARSPQPRQAILGQGVRDQDPRHDSEPP